MATIESCWINFEETMRYVVKHFKLNGNVLRETIYHRYEYIIVHSFVHEYISIHDYHFLPMNIETSQIMDFCVEKIKEIDYQFRFYFQGIWG